ncbi:MAG: hypothetical protein RLZZ306_192 [Bacteroidota bacterium]|jgi:hypothetical protein
MHNLAELPLPTERRSPLSLKRGALNPVLSPSLQGEGLGWGIPPNSA